MKGGPARERVVRLGKEALFVGWGVYALVYAGLSVPLALLVAALAILGGIAIGHGIKGVLFAYYYRKAKKKVREDANAVYREQVTQIRDEVAPRAWVHFLENKKGELIGYKLVRETEVPREIVEHYKRLPVDRP